MKVGTSLIKKCAVITVVLLMTASFVFARGATEDVTTLRWGDIPGDWNDPVVEHFGPEYEKLTGVRVRMEVMNPSDLVDKALIESMQRTNYYQIMYLSPGWHGLMNEYLADLTPYIEKYNFDLSQYPPLAIESHAQSDMRPGEIIGIPHVVTAPMFIWRKDIFDHPDEKAAFRRQYGRELVPPTTIQDLYDVAVFFTREPGERLAGKVLEDKFYGHGDSIMGIEGLSRSFSTYVYSTGLQGFDENFVPDVDHPILLEAADLYIRLKNETMPEAAHSWPWVEHLEYFRDGRMATALMVPIAVSTVEDPRGQSAGKTGYSPFPKWEGNLTGLEQGNPFLQGGGIGILDGPHAEEAFQFIQWLLEENESEWINRTNQFSRTNHFSDPNLLADKRYQDFLPAFEKALEQVFLRQGIPEYSSAVYYPMADVINDIDSGARTPVEAQRAYYNQMRNAFESAGYYD